jgi:hypothetical protein
MVIVTFSDNGITYDKNAFFQYDYGQKIEVHGLNLPDGTQFHFANKGAGAVAKISTTVGEVTTVDVPQSVLLLHGEMNVYIYSTSETSGITIKSITFNVKGREKPGDYAPPDEPNIIEELQAKLDQIIATGIASYTPDPQDVIDIIDDYVPGNLITNNDIATIPGTAWDAVRGKAARDDITILQNDKLDKNGDTKDNTVSFTEAVVEADINTTETHATIFGKIKKSIKTFRTSIAEKFALSNIIHTTVVNDTTKVPSSAVTYSLAQSVQTLNDNLVVEDLSSSVTVSLTGLVIKLRRYGKHVYVLDFAYSGTAEITNGIVCAILTNSDFMPMSDTLGALTAYNTTLIYNTPMLTVSSGSQITISGCTVASGTLAVISGQVIWIR